MVFKSILEILSFLTIIPIGKLSKTNGLENISKRMFLFPFIGLLIGLLTTPVVLLSFYFFNQFVASLIVAIFLIVLTGIHHTDALADFADGIMVRGNKDKKYKVMHDPGIGAAGTIAVSAHLVGMVIAISSITSLERLMIGIILSEIISKYSMVLQSHYCVSAWNGYSSLFTKNMKSKKENGHCNDHYYNIDNLNFKYECAWITDIYCRNYLLFCGHICFKEELWRNYRRCNGGNKRNSTAVFTLIYNIKIQSFFSIEQIICRTRKIE